MKDEGCGLFALIVALCLVIVVGTCSSVKDNMGEEFRTCRTQLATLDSATVIATRPECAKWTLPPKETP